MKKTNLLRMIIAAALVLGLVFSFGACQTTDQQPSATPDATESATPEATEAPSTEASVEPTAEKPVLTMATNAYFQPYEYYEGQQIIGIDAEIAQLIADKLGMTLKIDDMEFNSVIAAVATGKDDIGMAALTIKPDRLESVDFSTFYATGKQVIIVKEDSAIAGPSDLAGKLIGVQLGTTGDSYCTDDFGETSIQRFDKGADAVQALIQNKVDCVVIDNEPAKIFVAQNTGLKILESEYALEDYAIAVSKGNTELLDKINAALAELQTSGELQAIIDKYINAN